MEREEFKQQIERLRSQWPKAYGPEREKILWQVFQRENLDTFKDAVSNVIATCRVIPLMNEIDSELKKELFRAKQRRELFYLAKNPYRVTLSLSSIPVDQTKKDFSQICLHLLHLKETRKISKEVFLKGCDALDEFSKDVPSDSFSYKEHLSLLKDALGYITRNFRPNQHQEGLLPG